MRSQSNTNARQTFQFFTFGVVSKEKESCPLQTRSVHQVITEYMVVGTIGIETSVELAILVVFDCN